MTAVATRSGALTRPNRAQTETRLARMTVAPIVAAVDGSPAGTVAAETAVRLAARMDAPLVFVYVRRGPAGFLGAPVYQHRLSAAMRRARRVLGSALAIAARASVAAEGEILEGSPHKRILEFARDRSARLVVVGRRRRKLGRRVSSAVVRTAERPVVVAQQVTRSVVAASRATNEVRPHLVGGRASKDAARKRHPDAEYSDNDRGRRRV